MDDEDKEEIEDGVDVATVLTAIGKAFIFQIPPKPSAQGHSAEQWPKQALWAGRLKVLQTNTQCVLQLEHTDKDGIYLKVPVNTHESGDLNAPQTIEPVIDSSRYFALTILKPNTVNQYFELGLGFENRDDSSDFKSALQEYERIKRSMSKAKEEIDKLVTEDFALHENEMLDIKPIKNNTNKKILITIKIIKIMMTCCLCLHQHMIKNQKKNKNTKNDNNENENDNNDNDDDFSNFVSNTTTTNNTNNNTNNDNSNKKKTIKMTTMIGLLIFEKNEK